MIDLKKVTVNKTTMAPSGNGKAKRDLGPNVFLDKSWPGNLTASYDDATAFTVVLPGKIEQKPMQKGEKKGQMVAKPTGDAADAILLLRDAADKLQLGVAIKTYAGTYPGPDGKPVKVPTGHLAVVYQAQKRKQYRKNTPDNTPDPAPENLSAAPENTVLATPAE